MTTNLIDTAAVTRTCQTHTADADSNVGVTTAHLVATLERTWTTIRIRHSDVPPVIIVLGSGSPTRPTDGMLWGHFDRLRWQHGPDRISEVLISGEGLSRKPAEILTTLLHEAAHGLAYTRQLKDTSRQGRWHNKTFAKHAMELGLTPSKDPKLGWSPCTLNPDTAEAYADQLDAITAAVCAWRHPELPEAKQRTNSNNGVSAECDCGRKIRMSLAVYDAGPITCGICNSRFHADTPDDEPADDSAGGESA